MNDFERIRSLKKQVAGLEKEVERLEGELKLERQRSKEWKAQATRASPITTADAERARHALGAGDTQCLKCHRQLDIHYAYCRNCGMGRDGKQMPMPTMPAVSEAREGMRDSYKEPAAAKPTCKWCGGAECFACSPDGGLRDEDGIDA